MTPRFQFGRPAPRDSEIIARATNLKIEMYRDGDGDIHGEVKVSCGFGMFSEDEEDFDGSKQRAALRFVRDVLAAFEQKPDDGTAAAS